MKIVGKDRISVATDCRATLCRAPSAPNDLSTTLATRIRL
jgi:hypothetical protein